MVAIIKTGSSIHRILNYNENKVNEGVAVCLGAGNYPVDHDQMSFTMKLKRFTKQLELHENIERNSVHISLNFDVSESNLPREKLLEIAETYMEKIGFENQPFLVYQHFDAGHPHIHIVSIKINPEGKRIDMNNIGRNQSEDARKAIEQDYGLVRAEGHQSQSYHLQPVQASKVLYGKTQTKRAIQNVLNQVISQYKYKGLNELNAVLGLYNVRAVAGSENSRMQKYNGLLYRILDGKGNPVGIPVKASTFYSKPTLKELEPKFAAAEKSLTPHRSRLKNTIDLSLKDHKPGLKLFIEDLKKLGIDTVLRQNDLGYIYGITYIDHRTKCVFNGSDLGKNYSAKIIQERCGASKPGSQQTVPESVQHNAKGIEPISFNPLNNQSSNADPGHSADGILGDLLGSDQDSNYQPFELSGKARRKRRKKKSKS